MRALVQRVTQAYVTIDAHEVARVGKGLVVLLGVGKDDVEADAEYLVGKLINLRIFADEQDRFELSALDTNAEFLVVSQFTLYADTRNGRRPSFTSAAAPEDAVNLYEYAVYLLREKGITVATGRFQEHMEVSLANDGPVTIMLDSSERHRTRRD